MKKLDFWRADGFLGVVVALIVLAFCGRDPIQSLEREAYELGVQTTASAASDEVAVIAIDDQSIASIGRWPRSREVRARMTDMLTGAKVEAIVNSAFLFESRIDPGPTYFNKLIEIHGVLPRPALRPMAAASAARAAPATSA